MSRMSSSKNVRGSAPGWAFIAAALFVSACTAESTTGSRETPRRRVELSASAVPATNPLWITSKRLVRTLYSNGATTRS